jgi:hypothetical protein
LQWGVRTVLLRPHGGGAPRLSFLITTRHSVMDIDNCLAALDDLANGVKSIRTRR